MKITAAMLKSRQVHDWYRETFKELWPHGADMNLQNVRKAMAHGLYPDRIADHFFGKKALVQYKRVCAVDFRIYKKAVAKAEASLREAGIRAFVAAAKIHDAEEKGNQC